MKGWSYSAVTLIVMVMSLSNCVQANDSLCMRHLKQCLNPLYVQANSGKILPIPAIKDSTEGVCFISLDVLSNALDSSIVYSAHFIDSLLQFKIRLNLNEVDCAQMFHHFMSMSGLLSKSDAMSGNCLVKGRRGSKLKHVMYIDDQISNQNQYLWIWNEFKNGNYYQWNSCEGIFTKEDYFYCLYAR